MLRMGLMPPVSNYATDSRNISTKVYQIAYPWHLWLLLFLVMFLHSFKKFILYYFEQVQLPVSLKSWPY
jgi:hypothetical protein